MKGALFLPLSLLWLSSPGYAQDQFCFMIRSSGEVVDLTSICTGRRSPAPAIGTGSPAPATATSFEPVGANLAITRGEGERWVVSGFLTNQTQARMDILGVQFDVLDAEGTLIYTDVLVPRETGFGPGQDRFVMHMIPLSRIVGTPASVVPTQSRYVQR